MSTMTFPHRHSPPPASVSSLDSHSSHQHQHFGHEQHNPGVIPFYPASYDPHASTSSFQVNPLSQHPPRTPRTSLLGAHAPDYYGGGGGIGIVSTMEEQLERPAALEGGVGLSKEDVMHLADEDDDNEDALNGRTVAPADVWREVVASSRGRDKALKLVQYTMRVYVLFHAGLRRRRTRSPLEVELFRRLDAAMAGLSLSRKCLLLFNWLTPLSAIRAPQSTLSFGKHSKPARPPPLVHRVLHAPPPVLLDLLNALADDGATLAKLGLVGPRLGGKAGDLANWCWFAATLVGLVEVGVERGMVRGLMDEAEGRMYASTMDAPNTRASEEGEKELQRLRKQDYWLQVSRMKLLFDLVFVSYECFHFKRARQPAMAFSGLLSAVLSSMKLYDQHRATLLKAMTRT